MDEHDEERRPDPAFVLGQVDELEDLQEPSGRPRSDVEKIKARLESRSS